MKQRRMKPCVETGSFVNMMMSSNSTLPEVGKGATLLSWSDRHAYEVMEVSEDKKTVVVQQYLPERIDTNGMSECQEYKYEKLNGCNETIVWKWGAWRKKTVGIEYINLDLYSNDHFTEEGILRLMPGITEEKTRYQKVNILWGVKQEYYDFTM